MSERSVPGHSAAFETAEIPHALTQIARLHEGVKAEFDLIAGRMTWLVISESFFFSAFAAALASYRSDHPLAGVLIYLVWIMPFVGMLLAACVYLAILAAHSAIGILKSERERMMACVPKNLRIDLIARTTRVQWWGDVPTHIIPPILFLIWAGALAVFLAR